MNSAIDRRVRHILLFTVSIIGAISLAALDTNARGRASLADSPTSVATVTSDMLDQTKWTIPTDLSKITTFTPGFTSSTSTTNVTIRGVNNAAVNNRSPLYIVNGQRVRSISDIDPMDIDQVNILKGNSASVLYGADAVAGVVNIITKTPREEGRSSFRDPDSSLYRGDPYQAGFRSMTTATVDPVGQSLFGYYDNGGSYGADAGAMYASSVKLRWNLGGPLCDGGGAAAQDWSLPSEEAGGCLANEMLDTQAIYDSALGTGISSQQKGDFLAYGLNGMGFDRKMAGNIALSRVPEWAGWGKDPDITSGLGGLDWDMDRFKVNPQFLDHLLDYSPGRNGTLAAPDGNPYTMDGVFGEKNLETFWQQSLIPNDPLYKKPDGAGSQVGGILKKGFGALLGAGGFGVQTSNEDSRADDQWGLHAIGFTPMGTGNSAWDVIDGRQENVVVAVIDSGLDLGHPDRPRFLWTNSNEIPDNGIDDDTNGYVDDIHGWNFVAESNNIDDDYGHGTFVAGIIAANSNNGEGIAGVNPGARIMTLKVGEADRQARSLAIYRALRYAVDNGARVINISLGRKGLSRLEQIGINYAYAMGSLVVVAAGNQGSNIAEYGPPGARRVVPVASMNIDGTRRSQSNKGLLVAVAAPGESIYSLTAGNGKRDGNMIPFLAGDYHRLNGTSFAAPFVAGTASLIWARYPHLSNRQVADMILAGAVDVEDPGWDIETGMGQLNARTALTIEPEAAFAPRITEWIINRDPRGKIDSVDVYGVIRGPVASYSIEVGEGNKPKGWTPAFGPTNRTVDHGHITRIPGSYFRKGSRWSIQLTATAENGQRRIQVVEVRKDS
ncbi:MAG: S8 family serine peptidase [Desulforhopalus sp.]